MRRYAVVDIETTGPSFKEGDKIIQIGLVQLSDQGIEAEYSWDIQPDQKIPPRIVDLTGITDEQLAPAPRLRDIADDFLEKLGERILVAHNINFDYKFLSRSLERLGYPPLSNEGIDTVELIRLLYPCDQSYKLGDFAEKHGISLVHAHSALDDARATAHILLLIQDRIRQLSYDLFQSIQPLTARMIRQTGTYLNRWVDDWAPRTREGLVKKGPFYLAEQKGQGLVFPKQFGQDQATSLDLGERAIYVGQGDVHLTGLQEGICRDLSQFFDQDQERLACLDAPAGSGKSLAYLLAALQSSPGQADLVLATSTRLLQDRLAQESLQQVADILGRPLRYVQLKSSRHYIDLSALEAFHHDLLASKQVKKRDALLLAGLMIWLAQSQTGLLVELNPGLLTKDFTGQMTTAKACDQALAKWGDHAYYAREWQAIPEADLVLTNQAFLCQHQNDLEAWGLLSSKGCFLVDESHQLLDTLQSHGSKAWSSQSFEKQANHIQKLLANLIHFPEAYQFSGQSFDELYQSSQLIQTVWQSFDQLMAYLEENYRKLVYYKQQSETKESFMLKSDFQASAFYRQLKEVQARVSDLSASLIKLCQAVQVKAGYSKQRLDQLKALVQEQRRMNDQLDRLLGGRNLDYYVLNLVEVGDNLHCQVQAKPFEDQALLDRFLKGLACQTVFISASPLAGRDFETKPVRYSYKTRQALQEVFVLMDGLSIDKMNAKVAAAWTADCLLSLWPRSYNRVLVLVNAKNQARLLEAALKERLDYQSFQKVYSQLNFKHTHKLFQLFDQEDSGLLIGLQNFSEGVHFKQGLDLVLLPRLPFAAPEAADELAKQALAREEGRDYFETVALPDMLVRLKQAIGRAANGQSEPAAFLSLDQRLVKSAYADKLQAYLASTASFTSLCLEELKADLQDSSQDKG
ncbi:MULTISPECIES: exonuclease domain-containing protein [Aerococcus]|uniref:DNA polymerase III polC-type n=1 Tax=Aerococcus sanguinicola TaxID=119206 RepID=A0A5N1GKJ5_9LACT|nr:MULTISPECIES: exonuclease domain-containing protein [Aerococcus]KAA9300934.1 hypothetical protein F6I03_06405 [Aerococcus sanguinicola]MDK6679773.1 exonuclease domain-containing protein [Aerococcus sp. UMB8608]MDK6939695.1 exonuclease domain-containing protein [Aerococcus sp. UMB8487]OFK21993.1 hypothetical protein HMPREF2829_02680 [Aerococcus sp. HMSC072A12]OFT43671.1 hypothetical protein HMPREF3161_00600 [Aerococcus sp. HMSC06H08]